MKILSIQHLVPGTALSNDSVIERVERESCNYLNPKQLSKVTKHLTDLFDSTGLKNRYITEGNQKPIDILKTCAESALSKADIKPKDLDFIIYGGVTRGFLVPSSASALQYAIGASGVSCFDVLDACASWARAMQVAQSFIDSGMGERGLIVNCECGAYQDCNPWPIKSLDDLEQRTAAFTLGEAATATVVCKQDPGKPEPEFHTRSYGEFGDLATLPIVDNKDYTLHKRQPTGRITFFTHPQELTYAGFKLGVKLLKDIDPLRGRTADAFIPHAGAAPSVDMFIKTTGIKHKQLIMSFYDYGNTITASIPLGLSLAVRDGRIKRGDTIFGATVAAGISVVALFFEY